VQAVGIARQAWLEKVLDQTVGTLGVGRVEYGAIRQAGSAVLMVAWRYRAWGPARWFRCGELVPEGNAFAVRGWDGQPIGMAASVRAGLDAVRQFNATMAIGSAEASGDLRF
jgi:hypothetical protein